MRRSSRLQCQRMDGASEPLGKDEIVAAVKDRGKEEEEDGSESNMESSLHYLQQQGSCAIDVLFLRRLCAEAARHRIQTEKQSYINNF